SWARADSNNVIRWIALFALGVLLLLPIGVGPYPIRVATVIFMWAALAGSWNLLAGYAGAVDLGPVVYHGIGAFVTAALMLKLGLPFLVSAGLADRKSTRLTSSHDQ